jgi:Putative zincin peptidase
MSAYNNALSLSHRSIPMAVSFAFGKPPSNPIVTSQPGWTPIPGYDDSMRNMLRAVGIGLAFAATLAIAWHSLVPQGLSYDASPALLSMVLVFLITTVGHEICHLLPFPRLGFGNAVLGLWLQVGGLYIQYLQPVTRSRFIVVLLSPAVIISVVPLIAGICGVAVPEFLTWASILNGVGASADLLAVVQLLRHSNKGALLLDSNQMLYQRQI